jgi:hypothetical protein
MTPTESGAMNREIWQEEGGNRGWLTEETQRCLEKGKP